MHIYLVYSWIVVGMIVIEAFGSIDAGCIYSNLIFSISIDYSSTLLVHRAQNMEELGYVGAFVLS